MARILVVDDEPHVTRLVQQRLRGAGYEVDTARNGLEAIGCIEASDYAAIVTDYNMPQMDGRQLVEWVRKERAGKDIGIYLVTARLEERVRAWAEGMPSVEYIEKPLSVRDLLARLESRLRKPEPRDA
jgi:DNA-binding response OmpR family regulator